MDDATWNQSYRRSVWIVGILSLAFVVRLAYIIWWVVMDDLPVFDAENYHHMGIDLLESGHYSNILYRYFLPSSP